MTAGDLTKCCCQIQRERVIMVRVPDRKWQRSEVRIWKTATRECKSPAVTDLEGSWQSENKSQIGRGLRSSSHTERKKEQRNHIFYNKTLSRRWEHYRGGFPSGSYFLEAPLPLDSPLLTIWSCLEYFPFDRLFLSCNLLVDGGRLVVVVMNTLLFTSPRSNPS